MTWLARAASEPDGTPSTGRTIALFGTGVTAGVLVAMTWLIHDRAELVAPILADALHYFISVTVAAYCANKVTTAYVSAKTNQGKNDDAQ